MRRRLSLVPAAALLCLAWACASPEPEPDADAPGPTPTVVRTPIGELPDIDLDALLLHTKELSSDRFEGRGPGTKGEELTVNYLVDQFRKIGLRPGTSDGTYTQQVPLVGITTPGAPLTLAKGDITKQLRWKDDLVAWTRRVSETASLENSELVFVGYGVVAPEFGWDDYKGLDVKGKTLVMLINDPPIPDPSNPEGLDPKLFGGKAMTYYGRWTYKYEVAAEKGAAGVLIVHEAGPAGYGFDVLQSSNLSEKFHLVAPDKNMGRASIEGWITNDAARSLFALSGKNFDTLKGLAATPSFTPVRLGVTGSITLHNTIRTVPSQNVIARLDGRDPKLRSECVVYTAHWDHLGIGPEVNGDRIYHGAKDNALGVGGLLEIARAFTRLPRPPRRSIIFLSVTAEEQGLLGSEHYSITPVVPLVKTAAAINMDGMNVNGRTRDLTLVGYGASDLDDYARDAAAEQGRVIRPDPEPEKGFYYRSDHFNFAKQGVPALDPDEGIDFIGKPPGYGQQVRSDYTEHDYHRPSDVVKADWDLTGTVEDLKALFAVGYRVAEADRMPEWKAGHEFRAKREAALSGGPSPKREQ